MAVAEYGGGRGSALPLGELRLSDCVIRGASAVLWWESSGAVSLEAANCLVTGPGAVLRLARCPRRDEPVQVSLERVTMRGGMAVVKVISDWIEAAPGALRVHAADSVFVPGERGALYLFRGEPSPTALLDAAEWSGQGCIVASGAPLAVWQSASRWQRASDDAVRAAGLVRSELEFAGPDDAGAEASRVVRWQVPLTSPDPPGFRGLPEVANARAAGALRE